VDGRPGGKRRQQSGLDPVRLTAFDRVRSTHRGRTHSPSIPAVPRTPPLNGVKCAGGPVASGRRSAARPSRARPSRVMCFVPNVRGASLSSWRPPRGGAHRARGGRSRRRAGRSASASTARDSSGISYRIARDRQLRARPWIFDSETVADQRRVFDGTNVTSSPQLWTDLEGVVGTAVTGSR